MHVSDLLNNDGRKIKYYFTKHGRMLSVTVYDEFFVTFQHFGENIAKKYPIERIEAMLTSLKKGAQLLETIKY